MRSIRIFRISSFEGEHRLRRRIRYEGEYREEEGEKGPEHGHLACVEAYHTMKLAPEESVTVKVVASQNHEAAFLLAKNSWNPPPQMSRSRTW